MLQLYLARFFLNMFGRELNLDFKDLDTLNDSMEQVSSGLLLCSLYFLTILPPVVLLTVLEIYFSHGAFLPLPVF